MADGTPRREWPFILLWLAGTVLAVVAAVRTPPFVNPDEGAHYLRSYEVAHGHWLNLPGRVGIDLPCAEYRIAGVQYAPMAYYTPVDDRLAADPVGCRARSVNSAGMYSPVPYVFSAVGMRLAEAAGSTVENRLRAGRAANALASSLLCLIALLAIRHHRAPLAVLAVMPMTFWLRASLSADALTITLALCFLCYVIWMGENTRPVRGRHLWGLLAMAALLGSTKVIYGLVCFSSLALADLSQPVRSRLIGLVRLMAPGIVSLLVARSWLAWSAPELVYLGHGAQPAAQVAFINANPLQFLEALWGTLFGELHWHTYNFFLPRPWLPEDVGENLVLPLAALLGVTAVAMEPLFVGWRRLGLALLGILGFIGAMTPLYLTYTPVGHVAIFGVQGRYFIPFVMLLVMAMAGRPRAIAAGEGFLTLSALGVPLAVNAYLATTWLA